MKKDCYINLSAKLILISLLVLCPSSFLFSQSRNRTYNDYILKYKHIAIGNMQKYRIPASIILAQGLLESGAGTSTLAVTANNHFGIKCAGDWKGKKVYKKDDGPNDCFRKYNAVEESFEDHAMFLKRPRYTSLFSLGASDYAKWAEGLQRLGYATDKTYAEKLKNMIKLYELHMYDKEALKEDKGNKIMQYKHIPYRTHGLVYVIAEDGDTFESIAREFNLKAKDLYNYNEVPSSFPLKEGDWVYFQKKKSKADKPYTIHVVRSGDSMYTISQRYGIRYKNLYKLNQKGEDYVPSVGDMIKLR